MIFQVNFSVNVFIVDSDDKNLEIAEIVCLAWGALSVVFILTECEMSRFLSIIAKFFFRGAGYLDLPYF